MDTIALAEGDHLFRERTDGFRFGEGGFDAFVLDEAADLIREQGIAMGGATTEFDSFLTVAHGVVLRLIQRSFNERRVDLVTEAEAELLEFFFDFVKRFLAEVADLHQIVLGKLSQLANRKNVCLLQAIISANREVQLLDTSVRRTIRRAAEDTRRPTIGRFLTGPPTG